ncbi:MAG: hypothetical protein ACOYXC_03045, partial [Candidatus Rifleibacteriota bacterium]
MKLDPSTPKIDVKSISRQVEAQNRSARMRNKAATSFQKSSGSQKPAATRQFNEAVQSAGSTQRASYNQRLSALRSTTGKMNEVARQRSTEANVMMAKVISPPGSQLNPQQL